MNIIDIPELWKKIKERPIAYLAAIAIVMFSAIFSPPLINHIRSLLMPSPFESLTGKYLGETEEGEFHFCVKVFGDKVKGQLYFLKSTHPEQAYMEFDGDIKNKNVDLTWKRNSKHPNGHDEGIASITPRVRGNYDGYWESTKIDNSQEIWTLTEIADTCQFFNWGTP